MDLNILVFEDQSFTSNEIVNYLKNAGYQNIFTAESVKEAMDKIKENYPDLAILDVKTPDDENAGIKIADFLNNKKRIPIVFLTAFHKESKRLILNTKPSAFLSKPFEEHDLINSIDLAVETFFKTGENNNQLEIAKEPIIDERDKEIWIRNNNSMYNKVRIADILYVEGMKGSIRIVTLYESFLYSSTLIQFSNQIKDDNLIKIHKSYLVYFPNVISYNHETVVVKTQKEMKKIPINKTGYNIITERTTRFRSK